MLDGELSDEEAYMDIRDRCQ